MKNNPDIKNTDLIDMEERITLTNSNDLNTVNPKQEVIEIKITEITVGDFLDRCQKELEAKISNLEKDTMYSISEFNQSIHFKNQNEKDSKSGSGYTVLISKGNIVE